MYAMKRQLIKSREEMTLMATIILPLVYYLPLHPLATIISLPLYH